MHDFIRREDSSNALGPAPQHYSSHRVAPSATLAALSGLGDSHIEAACKRRMLTDNSWLPVFTARAKAKASVLLLLLISGAILNRNGSFLLW